MLERTKIGSEAFLYIRECLKEGNFLSETLLNLAWEEGEVTCFLPLNVNPDAVSNFRAGGVMRSDETIFNITDFVDHYLCSSQEHTAVFEDVLALPSDPFLVFAKFPFFTLSGKVYYYLEPTSSKELIERTIRSAFTYLFVGVLAARQIQFHQEQEVQPNVIQSLAHKIDYVLMGAYDGEGILIWSRTAEHQ